MSELLQLQPPDGPISTGPLTTIPTILDSSTALATIAISSPPPPSLIPTVIPSQQPSSLFDSSLLINPLNNTTTTANNNTNNLNNTINSNNVAPPKRQRRPSVRLGEIGDPTYDPSHTTNATTSSRRPKTWRFHKDPSLAAKTSKTRPLTNLVNGAAAAAGTTTTTNTDYHHHGDPLNDNNNNYTTDFINRKPKSRRPATKRVRTNWASSSKFDNSNGGMGALGTGVVEGGDNLYREENDHEDYREFEPENSESPLKEQSPVNSMENMGLQYWDRRGSSRARVSESLDPDVNDDDINDGGGGGGFHNEMNSSQGRSGGGGGVREWLIGLGLGRYAPVFEIHEVDDEVLPMLTLEDLKDMGINAVGSRRKMYTAILKLRKGFS